MDNWYKNNREKEQQLIDKYGLPDDLASRIVRDFKAIAIITPEANETIRPTSKPVKNEAVIKKLIEAEPDWCKPAPSTYGIKYHVQQIDFKIDGKNHRIDDQALIEQIRKLIAQSKFEYTPKRRKLSSQRPLLRKVAKYLMDYSNEKTDYKKRVFVGRILSEFNSDFDIDFDPNLSNEDIQDKVKNLL